ncbi:MAG: prephenate dehydrogenase [Chthonomonas sp.]|nr:prephenate dehydrogenase [Chthonomonas sp.]
MAGELVEEMGLTVAVIGTGLVGGSIAQGLLESGFATQVLGEDMLPEALIRAKVSRRLNLPSDAENVQIWVLATPPDGVLEWLQRLAPIASPDAVITDTTSVKESICMNVPENLRSRFVGGHPLAGSLTHEKSSPSLFADLHWILTPNGADELAVKRIEQMVFALDAIPVHMTSADHDRHMATLSHLPGALASLFSRLGRDLAFAHLSPSNWPVHAGLNPDLWGQVLLQNRGEVQLAIDSLRQQLDVLEQALQSQDSAAIKKILEE